jgi:hypothetical protein
LAGGYDRVYQIYKTTKSFQTYTITNKNKIVKKFDIKTQSQTQQTQTQTQTHFISRFGEISPDPATKIQEITRFGEIDNHSRRKQSNQVSLPQVVASPSSSAVASPSSSNPGDFFAQASFFSFFSWQRHGHGERESEGGDGNERRERDDQVSTVRLRERKMVRVGWGPYNICWIFFFF